MSTYEPVEQSPIKVYYLTSDLDEELCHKLMQHLKIFERTNRMTGWHPGELLPGDTSTTGRTLHLEEAQLILLLISPDFIASDEIYTHDMQIALEHHASGKAYAVPILLRPGSYKDAPFAHLKVLPDNAVALSIWSNEDTAYANIANGIDRILECLEHKQPIDFSARTLLAQPRIERQVHAQEQPFRQRLLRNVHDFWIKGVLDKSLHNVATIELELQEQPAALANPWRFTVQEMSRPARSLRPGTRIITAYDEAGGELLILGEAGTGKTTLLLELTRALLERTEQDEDHPLPAVFNLSSWSEKRLPLSKWLIKELQKKYQISPNVAQQWINTQHILPLLDGLDEVTPDAFSACIAALNTYHRENDRASVVICCRSTTYLAQKARITLHSAMTIQPLTEQQIDSYLSSTSKLTELRTLLDQNAAMRTLAITPLWLSILTQVFHNNGEGRDYTILPPYQSIEHNIFVLYVESVQKRSGAQQFTYKATEHWLASLAWQMQFHHQRSFYLERVQPDWLAKGWVRTIYYLCMGCIGMVVFALIFWLLAMLTSNGQSWAWIIVLAGALLGGPGFILASVKIRPIEVIASSALRERVFSLFFSVILCLFILSRIQTNSLLDIIVIIAVALSLIPLFISELIKNRSAIMSPTSTLVMPDDGLRRSRRNGLWIGLIFGSGIALVVMLLHLAGLFQENLAIVGSLALVTGLLSGLIFGGLAAIQISVVRWLLWVTGVAPKNYVRFLDYAVERLLLYKIGGGYIFIHPLLQDYFATLHR